MIRHPHASGRFSLNPVRRSTRALRYLAAVNCAGTMLLVMIVVDGIQSALAFTSASLTTGATPYAVAVIAPNQDQAEKKDSPDDDSEGDTPKKRLEYRWETGKSYTYHVRLQTTESNKTTYRAGVVRYSVSELPARHETPEDVRSTSTAFVVHADGYLITCAHCVEDMVELEVALGGKKYAGKLVLTDDDNDLAVVQIDAKGLTVLPLGDSDKVQIGEEVWAMGFPLSDLLGAGIKATKGTIGGIEKLDGRSVFQVDAAINPGHSGGPLLGTTGEVIGVNFAKLNAGVASNVGFAVPIRLAKRLLAKRKIEPAAATDAQEIKGTELVKRATASCALLTAKTRSNAKRFKLNCVARAGAIANADQAVAESSSRKPFLRESLNQLTRFGDVIVDAYGRVVEVNADKNGPKGLGQIPVYPIEVLPPSGKKAWHDSQLSTFELDWEETKPAETPKGKSPPPSTNPAQKRSPFGDTDRIGGLGGPRRPSFGPNAGANADPKKKNEPEKPAVTTKNHLSLPVREDWAVSITESSADTTSVTRKFTLRTLNKSANRPSVEITALARTRFDLALGVPRTIDVKVDMVFVDGKEKTVLEMKHSVELIDESTLEGFGRPAELTASDLNGLLKDLAQPGKVRTALAELTKVQPTDAQRAQVIRALADVTNRIERQPRTETLPPPLGGTTGKMSRPSDSAAKYQALKRPPEAPGAVPLDQVAEVLSIWGDQSALPTWVRLLEISGDFQLGLVLRYLPEYHDAKLAAAVAQNGVPSTLTRERAAQLLVNMGDIAEPSVLALLDHVNGDARSEAMRLLGLIGSDACLSALGKRVAGDNIREAKQAHAAYVAVSQRLGKPEVELPLPAATPARIAAWIVQLKSSNTDAERRAAEAMQELPPADAPPREAAEALESVLDSKDVVIRVAAVQALRHWGTPESTPKLAALLVHPDRNTRREAEAVLRDQQALTEEMALTMLAGVTPEVRRDGVALAEKIGGETSIEKLNEFVETAEGTERGRAVAAIGIIARRINKPELARTARSSSASTPSSSSASRPPGASGAAKSAAERVAEANARNEERKAIDAMAKTGPTDKPTREDAEKLEAYLDSDDHFTRVAAAKALALWGTKESIPKLIAALKHKDVFVAQEAAKSLAHFHDERAAKALVDRFKDQSTQSDAAAALKEMGPYAERFVSPLLASSSDFLLLTSVCDVLKAIGTAKSIPALEAAGKKNQSIARKAADTVKVIRERESENRTKGKSKDK